MCDLETSVASFCSFCKVFLLFTSYVFYNYGKAFLFTFFSPRFLLVRKLYGKPTARAAVGADVSMNGKGLCLG